MRPERAILCLVTDRRRFFGENATLGATVRRLADLAAEAADAGIDLIQVRERDLPTNALVDLVGRLVQRTGGYPTRVVVNDRLDVALTCGASGVHLRGDSIAPEAARRIAPPGFLVGRSVHAVGEAAQTGREADYLIAGTVFPSASKASTDGLLGTAGLKAVVVTAPHPVLGIGGITVERVPLIAATGASGVAAIGLFMTTELSRVVKEVRARFDTFTTPS